jgi:5'-nucleotidase
MYAVVDEFEILDPYGAYELATNDYMAAGGSGFRVLGRNTTQEDLEIPLREAVVDHIRAGPPCTDNAPCTTSAECPADQICACQAVSSYQGEPCSWTERMAFDRAEAAACEGGTGTCILTACATDVAEYRGERVTTCGRAQSGEARDRCWCEAGAWALEECQTLACIDERVGALSDGRQRMLQP